MRTTVNPATFAATLMLAAAQPAVAAQPAYPAKPIRMLVPFSAGARIN